VADARPTDLTAAAFAARLTAAGAPGGVRMGQVFDLAKEFIDLPPDEIEELLDHPMREARVGGVSVMDKQARRNSTPELYDLYLRRMDRIDDWDLVDLGAPFVVGRYLFDRPRGVLYELARSENMWARRTAIVSTLYFVRKGDVADTFAIAELLLDDEQDLVRKATGGLLREAGKKDRARLVRFLDRYAATMPRVTLRYAIERLDRADRNHYLGLRRVGG
jgi:3-methyladenine DNA glycosylase AlkD